MHVPGGLKTERKNQFDRRLPAKNYYSLVSMAAVLTAALLPVAWVQLLGQTTAAKIV